MPGCLMPKLSRPRNKYCLFWPRLEHFQNAAAQLEIVVFPIVIFANKKAWKLWRSETKKI